MCVKHVEQQALSALLDQACQTHCALSVTAVMALDPCCEPTQLCSDLATMI